MGATGPAAAAAALRNEKALDCCGPGDTRNAYSKDQINVINDLTGPDGQLLSESMQLPSSRSKMGALGASMSRLTM